MVYDKGPVQEGYHWENFDKLRQRVADEWESLPRTAQVYSQSLQHKIDRISREHVSEDGKQVGQQQQQAAAASLSKTASNGSR